MDIDKLRGKMTERHVTMRMLSNELLVDRSTVVRMFGAGDERFSVAQTRKIGILLHLTADEFMAIFYPDYAA
jgi:hypothetical protein